MRRVEVLRIIARLNIGGPAIHTILLTAGLNNAGSHQQGAEGLAFESTLVTGVEGEYEGSMLAMATAKGVEPIIIPQLRRNIDPVGGLVTLVKLYRLMRREKPHIVHTHTATAGIVGRLAARLAGVPVVLHTFHGHVLRGYFGPLVSKALVWMERFLAHLSDRIVTVSEGQRRELAEYGVAPLQKITVVPLGFELEALLACETHRGELRRELGLADDRNSHKLVGIVARLVPIKNHHLFLQAAQIVAEAVPQARFLVVGDGELRGELEACASELGLNERVIFTGWRRDLPRVYADLDVVALTSINEGTPVSLIEAMAAGVPVVATAVGGVPEVVVSGETGYLVEDGDEKALAEAITELLMDSEKAKGMGNAGREAAYPRFAAQTLIANVEGLYDELLRQKT